MLNHPRLILDGNIITDTMTGIRYSVCSPEYQAYLIENFINEIFNDIFFLWVTALFQRRRSEWGSVQKLLNRSELTAEYEYFSLYVWVVKVVSEVTMWYSGNLYVNHINTKQLYR